jgi:hypothetical protein
MLIQRVGICALWTLALASEISEIYSIVYTKKCINLTSETMGIGRLFIEVNCLCLIK